MSFNVSVDVHNIEAEAFMGLLDSGSCDLRTGTQPANTTIAATGTLLVTIDIPATALKAAAALGKADLAVTTAVATTTAGTVGYARFFKTDGTTVVFDGSVTASGGGGDVIIDDVVLAVDDLVNIIDMSYTRS